MIQVLKINEGGDEYPTTVELKSPLELSEYEALDLLSQLLLVVSKSKDSKKQAIQRIKLSLDILTRDEIKNMNLMGGLRVIDDKIDIGSGYGSIVSFKIKDELSTYDLDSIIKHYKLLNNPDNTVVGNVSVQLPMKIQQQIKDRIEVLKKTETQRLIKKQERKISKAKKLLEEMEIHSGVK